MYQPLLTRKYLFSKVMPLLAALGVALSVCMVIVVWSVMGGFLSMLLDSGKQLIGDVSIRRDVSGIPRYEELIERLEATEEIEAATPVIQTPGLINVLGLTKPVAVWGIEPESYDRVTGLYERLYWRPVEAGDGDAAGSDATDVRRDVAGDAGSIGLARELMGETVRVLEGVGAPVEDGVVTARLAGLDEAERAASGASNSEVRRAVVSAVRAVLLDAQQVLARGDVREDGAVGEELRALFDETSRAWDVVRVRDALVPRLGAALEAGRSLRERDRRGELVDAAMLGVEVGEGNRRLADGALMPGVFLPGETLTVSVAPISARGAVLETVDRRFPIANEFRTGLFQADAETVIVPIEALQSMLRLEERQIVDPRWAPVPEFDPATGEVRVPDPPIVGVDPARATVVLVRASAGVTPDEAQVVAAGVYEGFAAAYADAPRSRQVQIYTWENQRGLRDFIAAVKKETALVLFLFVIISFTAVVLILAIFWSIVSEKTKDIGILRSVGASRVGVCWLFVRYGLVIGIVGSVAGSVLAYLIVTYINEIHGWLGRTFGLVIWDPSVYYFFRVPSEVDPVRFGIVFAGGVVSAALGAFVPAVRAATLDPVKALRFE